ncbi:MAG: SpoIIE family protein phosphatase [Gammaproteobacteria bacterium]|nr:SpoIIE family protein phosphatase [Gammaproteobacteria bacterium]
MQNLTGRIGLRMFVMSALMLVLLPIVVITGWISYRNAEQATEQFTYAMASEVSERIQERVLEFFDFPRRVLAYNQELAENGLLEEEKRNELVQKFLLQLRQQPLLTFVSIGMADGEYYGGNRPPRGADRGLRILHARIADERKLHIYRVDDTGQPADLLFKGDRPFDAREQPWFSATTGRTGIAWYPAYHYEIDDGTEAYEAMGIGVSAALFNPLGTFIGVATADVALSHLSEYLGELIAKTGGIAFIAESGGELLASSSPEPIYRIVNGEVVRLTLSSGATPLLRMAGERLAANQQSVGSEFVDVDGERHLLKWQSHQLFEGPRLTVGVLLPKARYAAVASDMLRNIIYLALTIALFSIIIGLFASNWIARPLRALSHSAVSLAAGRWPMTAPRRSPIHEVATLFASMEEMAQCVKAHSENLEQLVAERTQALEAAHLTLTDSINYALLIQNAILPDRRLAEEMAERHFVLWLPRDVVGGDFYFYRGDPQGKLFGVIDCAGHGVPGACMTMAAHAAIEVATQATDWCDPATILQQTDATGRNMRPLDSRIVASIDATFCHYTEATGTLTFAGAHQSMFWTDGTVCKEITGGRRSLNDRRRGSYANVILPQAMERTCYLVSDGLLDQVGGEQQHSFGASRLREWILQHTHLSLPEQRQALINTLNDYRGAHLQRDDITVFAFRVMYTRHP